MNSGEYAPTVMLITVVYIILSLPLMHDYTNAYIKQIPIFPGVPTRYSLVVHTLIFIISVFVIILTTPSTEREQEKKNITLIPFT